MSALSPTAAVPVITLVLGVVALVAGGALVADGGRRVRFYRRARSTFRRVDATVVESVVLQRSPTDDRAVPEVSYEYRVDGETYTSKSLWPTLSEGPPTVDADLARRVVEDHPEGAEVIAHYDPDEPATAYLIESGDAGRQYGELAAGSLLLVAGLALVATLLPV